MKGLFGPFGKLLVSLLVVMVFLPALAPGGKHVYINDEVEFRTYIYDPETLKVIHTIYLWPEPHETAFFMPGN